MDSKPRYDKKIFNCWAQDHRDYLPSYCCLTDIDGFYYINAKKQVCYYDGQNILFMEYRHGKNGVIDMLALIETKKGVTDIVGNSIFDKNTSSNRVLKEIANNCGAKFFFVVGEKEPYVYYEMDTNTWNVINKDSHYSNEFVSYWKRKGWIKRNLIAERLKQLRKEKVSNKLNKKLK